MAITQRLQRLRQKLLEKDLDSILVTQPENCRYLSGFTGSNGSAGTLLISQDGTILATDFIHFEQAKGEAPEFNIVTIKNASQWATILLSGQKMKRLGFEATTLCFADYRRLAEEANKLEIQIFPTEGLVESLRAVKEKEEITCLARAVNLADNAVKYITDQIRPGMTEKEAAWRIEKYLRENGSEPIPFDIIVASGPNAALPHAKPTERTISTGEPIIIDLGARISGYASDLTRSICLGPQDETFSKVYNLVLRAQSSAIANLEAGMTGAQVDSFARMIIDQGGYKEAFGHGLGHGVGLAIHEEPRLGPNSTNTIVENMVFTIEPGVYVSGWGGIRIEDMAVIQNGKAKMLTKADKHTGSSQ